MNHTTLNITPKLCAKTLIILSAILLVSSKTFAATGCSAEYVPADKNVKTSAYGYIDYSTASGLTEIKPNAAPIFFASDSGGARNFYYKIGQCGRYRSYYVLIAPLML